MIFKPILPFFVLIPVVVILLVLCFWNKGKVLQLKTFVRAGIVVLLGILLARPMVTGVEVETMNNGFDVILVVDTTLSMVAEDYNGKDTRLSGVKTDLKNIADVFKGARFSLITYANYPKVAMPLSSDRTSLEREINVLSPENSNYARGSNLSDVKEDLEEILVSTRELQKESGEKNQQTIVFFLGDGEFTRKDEEVKSFGDLRSLVDGGCVLGYGTESGAPMKGDKENDYDVDSSGYVLDTSSYPYKRGVSKIDESSLRKLASDLGISYFHAENSNSTVSEIRKVRTESHPSSDMSESASDIYFVFIPPLLILFVVEFINNKRNII